MKPLFLVCLLAPGLVQAQRWHINVSGGLSNYSGDLQAKYFTLDQSNFAFGAGAQYDITRNFSVNSMISLMKVSASDQFNKPNLQFRNLSFQSSIIEWNLLGEYTFFDITRSKVSPFIFAGIAAFHFDLWLIVGLKFLLHKSLMKIALETKTPKRSGMHISSVKLAII